MELLCIITSYKDERRVESSILNASHWAEEIIVFDKSRDGEIARLCSQHCKATRIEIPYSAAGEEDRSELFELINEYRPSSPAWVLTLTAGDVVTPGLVKAIEIAINGNKRIPPSVRLITKTYSFGESDESGPWKSTGTARLFRRDTAKILNGPHTLIHDTEELYTIGNINDAYVLHQTHADAGSFLKRHIGYAKSEAKAGMYCKRRDLVKTFLRLVMCWITGRGSEQQRVAMLGYQCMRVLFHLEGAPHKDVLGIYEGNRARVLEEWRATLEAQGA